MPLPWRLAETSDTAKLQVLDDSSRHRPQRDVMALPASARPEVACLAERLLDVEQKFVLRDWPEIIVHGLEHGTRT